MATEVTRLSPCTLYVKNNRILPASPYRGKPASTQATPVRSASVTRGCGFVPSVPWLGKLGSDTLPPLSTETIAHLALSLTEKSAKKLQPVFKLLMDLSHLARSGINLA